MQDKAFQIEYVRISPTAQIPSHVHGDTWELASIIRGSGKRTLGEITSVFCSGDVVLTPPRVRHCWKFNREDTAADGKIENLVVFIKESWMDSFTQSEPILGKVLGRLRESSGSFVLHGRCRTRVASLIRCAEGENESYQALRIIEALVVIAESIESEMIQHRRVLTPDERQRENFRIFVECNYMRHVTLADAAREAGLSRSLFCLRFRDLMSETFVTHLNSVRVREACRMLKCSTRSIAEISDATGFGDVTYFNRVFKKTVGCSPREWRRRNG